MTLQVLLSTVGVVFALTIIFSLLQARRRELGSGIVYIALAAVELLYALIVVVDPGSTPLTNPFLIALPPVLPAVALVTYLTRDAVALRRLVMALVIAGLITAAGLYGFSLLDSGAAVSTGWLAIAERVMLRCLGSTVGAIVLYFVFDFFGRLLPRWLFDLRMAVTVALAATIAALPVQLFMVWPHWDELWLRVQVMLGAGAIYGLLFALVLRVNLAGIRTTGEAAGVRPLDRAFGAASYRERYESSRKELMRVEVESKAHAEASRLRGEFLAGMSHELRTPLNSILGYTDLMLAGALGNVGDEQRDALETVSRNGDHLLRLIDSLLDLSKIDAGRFELMMERVDMIPLAKESLATVEGMARKKGVSLGLREDVRRAMVEVDSLRVRQVMINLLSNGVKFSEPGGEVTLSIKSVDDVVRCTVIDSGVGIAPDSLEKLFRDYVQVGDNNRRAAGSGLGLALSQKLMRLMGSEIRVESAVGRGSRFWFDLPLVGGFRRQG